MHEAEIIVLLFAAVAALVVVARKLALPYPVVLVLAGLALSFIPRLPEVKLNPNLVFFFFLPSLRNEHVINDEALRRIQRDLDLAETQLTGG
ncbi:MAG TPA: hypothetical protein DCO65_02870 [Spartobacteria bacterium]|jgi:hypothetical protein|nr:hypothetical protein [Spartobacteria bacterium]HAK06203.1 hypothetical protein [Spartobacteria bacterium]HCP91510.1 hypothetical protein [Spartobacteria bacterium]